MDKMTPEQAAVKAFCEIFEIDNCDACDWCDPRISIIKKVIEQQRQDAVEEERARSKWLPIETAPKLERIILWSPKWSSPLIGCRVREEFVVYVGPHTITTKATQWQPPPEPPTPGDEP